jgi:transcriptional regulator with XRE-family HTH domain
MCLKVTYRQGPKGTALPVTFRNMPNPDAETTAVLAAFAARVNELCDDMQVPADTRQTALAKHFGVNPKTARKWLLGIGYPEMPMAVRIADWADVSLVWLLQGYGAKRSNSRIDQKALVLDEAIHALPTDLRADLIDNIRAKLARIGRLAAEPAPSRYRTMLDAYEHEMGSPPKTPRH